MSKLRRDKGSGSQKLPPLSIPKVFITSEDDSTPPTGKGDFPMDMLLQGQVYSKDEDTGSTAPLLDSGTATPLCEEPSVPLNMGTFLASSQKLKTDISSEEICLSSFDAEKDPEVCSKESGDNQLNLPDYPFVKWPWKYIRIFSTIVATLAILACFSSSATLIAHLPQRCDPSTEWWQGKVFYELFPASFYDSDSDGIGDLNGINLKLDYYLQGNLQVDGLRLSSIFESSSYPEHYLDIVNATRVDPRLGDIDQLQSLVSNLEKRNMSLILDIPIDRIPGIVGSFKVTHQEHMLVENVLKFWLLHGVHGFYLKGLATFAHQPDLWKNIAKWKTLLDSFSSKFSKRRIMIASSDFILQYSLQHPLLVPNALKQFELLDHNLNLERPSRLEEQIREGLRWDSSVDMPWIMWNVGTLGKSRLADFHLEDGRGCILTVGVLMLALGLPGSASVLYGDEIGLPSITNNSSSGGLESTAVMKWSEGLNANSIIPTSSPWSEEDRNSNSYCINKSVELFGKLIAIRREALPLHVNAILKYDHDTVQSRTHNYVFKMLPNNTYIVERFYPRRHRFLLILNLGIKNVTQDISNTYFGGQTLISSTGRKQGYVKLNQLVLSPGEGIMLLLDK